MSAEINLRFFRAAAKVYSVPIMLLLAIAALGPANWAPRTAVAALLEGLPAFTPDRSAYIPAILYGGGGALAAALVAELFIRARRRHASRNAAQTFAH
jgi:hypothetical protein